MPDRKDILIALPLVRLQGWVGGGDSCELRDLVRREKISAIKIDNIGNHLSICVSQLSGGSCMKRLTMDC
jgi:hypothetical protein